MPVLKNAVNVREIQKIKRMYAAGKPIPVIAHGLMAFPAPVIYWVNHFIEKGELKPHDDWDQFKPQPEYTANEEPESDEPEENWDEE